MSINFREKIFTFIFIVCLPGLIFSQIMDYKKENPYKKIFVQTDNFGKSYLDTLEIAYKKVESDTIRFSILNDLAYYWHTRNLIKALAFTKTGLKITKEKKNRLWEGRFQITEGAILLRLEKLDSAYIVLEDAKNKVLEKDKAFINTQLGYVFERKGQLDRAADYALESLRLGEEYNDIKSIALAYSDLSNLFWKQSKFEKGLEYGLKSIQLFEKREVNDLDYDFTLYLVGNNLLALKKYQKALKYYNHAKSIGERYGFYNNLSDVYISLVDLYAFLNQYKNAEKAGVNAVKYAELLDNNFMLMRSWLSIGKLQILEGKYISSIENLKKSIQIATKDFGDAYYLSDAYKNLGKAYAGNHNYKDAYTAYAEYDKLKNKIFTTEANQHISLLQTEFEVAKKEDTIQIQESTIKRQKLNQTLIIVIAVLLLLLLLVLFVTYMKDRNKNKLLEQKNSEKEFLLKEIHHRVKNNLGIVTSLLELQSDQISDPKVIAAMQDSMNRVNSMSMIHQKLYQGKNLKTIEMKSYFINLAEYILDSFGASNTVVLDYKLNPIELDVDTAIPMGLIVNELLTNAFKYAFPENRKGKIKLVFKKLNKLTILLEVEDDGIGANPNNLDRKSGFGSQLINLLVKQLDGVIERNYNEGTYISIKFKLDAELKSL